MKRTNNIASLLGRTLGAVAIATAVSGTAFAQKVNLPDSSGKTTFSATVAQQCRINFPATVAFTVSDINAATTATANVSITKIVLNLDNNLKVSIQADAAEFSVPAGADPAVHGTWAASDVSWTATGWVNGTGAAGTLSNTAFGHVVTSDNNAASLSNGTMSFSLAPKDVTVAGTYQLVATWKVESI